MAAVIVLAVLGLAAGAPRAAAAPDHTARLTLAEPVFEWEGGPGTGVSEPFMGRNAGCGAPVGFDCDDILLEIAERGSLTITLNGPEETPIRDPLGTTITNLPDLDIHLYRSDAQGQRKGSSLTGSSCATQEASETCSVEALEPGFYLAQVEYWLAVDATYDAALELSPAPPPAVPDPTRFVEWSGAVVGDAVVELEVQVDQPATCDLVAAGFGDGSRTGAFVMFIRIAPDAPPNISSLSWGPGYITAGGAHSDPVTAANRIPFGARYIPTVKWSPGVHRLLLVGRGMTPMTDGTSMRLSASCDVPLVEVRWSGSREVLWVESGSTRSAGAGAGAGEAHVQVDSYDERIFRSPAVTGIYSYADFAGTGAFRLTATGPDEPRTWEIRPAAGGRRLAEVFEVSPGRWRAGLEYFAGAAASVELLLLGRAPMENTGEIAEAGL